MFEWLKNLISSKELVELNKRRALYIQYQQWFAEFPDISMVLRNMEIETGGTPFGNDKKKNTEEFLAIHHLREAVKRQRNKESIENFY